MALPAFLDSMLDKNALPAQQREQWRYVPQARLANKNISAGLPEVFPEIKTSLPAGVTYMQGELVVAAVCPEPLHIYYTKNDALYRLNVILAADASVTIVEHFSGMGVQLVQGTMHVAQSARLTHLRLPVLTAESYLFSRQHISVDGAYDHYALASGEGVARHDIAIALNTQGADARMHAGYVLGNNAYNEIASRIEHNAPNCASRQVVKGVVGDEARAVFQGKICVAQVAQDTDGYQLHKALLLSEKAEVNAKPELEIFADRVKCSHGVTIGHLDADALFYLQSRGIPLSEARQLLVKAFVLDVFSDIENTPLGDLCAAAINKALGDML